MPTVAEELCRIAVITNPTRIAANGLRSVLSSSTMCGDSLIDVMASPMMLSPINRIPNPSTTSPALLMLSFLQNMTMITPAMTNSGAISDRLNAISCPVTVVPILAPSMTPEA